MRLLASDLTFSRIETNVFSAKVMKQFEYHRDKTIISMVENIAKKLTGTQ